MTRAPFVICLAIALLSCGGDSAIGTAAVVDYSYAAGFWAAPFPSDSRLSSDGHVDVDAFPNVRRSNFPRILKEILAADARGFATTGTLYFPMSAALDPSVEAEYRETVRAEAPIYLVSVDSAAADFGVRYPVEVRFLEDGGPFGVDNLLSLLPLQGVPLRPRTRYAAVVTTSIVDAHGEPLAVAPSTRDLVRGRRPDAMSELAFASYQAGLAGLEALGQDLRAVAAVAVFTTDDPTGTFERVLEDALARPLPAPLTPLALEEVFDDFCVYRSELRMPVYQSGELPFTLEGGGWTFDDAGEPMLQGEELARLFVTVPRRPMPASGFPSVVFSRTGGGGDRPLIDRGVRPEAGVAGEPGTGPAAELAVVGYAGVQVDGPHGGLRNVTGADEQFLIFNVANPLAMRDNVRQSAVELALMPHVLETLTVDAGDCPGLETPADGPVGFDPELISLMGHSMGATITPLAMASEPRYRALLLSGAGGSWIQNVVYKQSPLEVRPLAELTLGIAGFWELHEHDPVLMMLQWAGEPADPPAYTRRILREPRGDEPARHVLMMQGIIDTYILPPIANAMSLSVGLDLGGEPLDVSDPDLGHFDPLEPLLDLAGVGRVTLPASGNRETPTGAVTAVVVQHPEGPIEDGHEVIFQTDAPKRQYRCFLATLASTGTPTVPAVESTSCD